MQNFHIGHVAGHKQVLVGKDQVLQFDDQDIYSSQSYQK